MSGWPWRRCRGSTVHSRREGQKGRRVGVDRGRGANVYVGVNESVDEGVDAVVDVGEWVNGEKGDRCPDRWC